MELRDGIDGALRSLKKREQKLQEVFDDQMVMLEEMKGKIRETMAGTDIEILVKLIEAHVADNPIKKLCEINGQMTKNLLALHTLASKPIHGTRDPLEGARKATIVESTKTE